MHVSFSHKVVISLVVVQHWGSDFSCTNTAPSDSVPTSGDFLKINTSVRLFVKIMVIFYFYFLVHRLRPADIKVIAALGDSITVSLICKYYMKYFPNQPFIWVLTSRITVFFCMQTGFGAKAKNLLQLRTEYKGVSWRCVTHKYTQQCITCKMKYYCFVFSIGGDEALETVTTLPSESLFCMLSV